MNDMIVQAAAAEPVSPTRRQTGGASQDSGSFKDMLSSALNSDGGEAAGVLADSQIAKPDAPAAEKPKPAATPKTDEKIPEAAAADAAAQAVAANQPGEAPPDAEETVQEQSAAIPQPMEKLRIPVAWTPRQIEETNEMPVMPETHGAAVTTAARNATVAQNTTAAQNAAEAMGTTDTAETATPQASPLPETAGTTLPNGTDGINRLNTGTSAQTGTRTETGTERQQTGTASVAADTKETSAVQNQEGVRINEARQTTRTVHAARPERAENPSFGEMLTKASRELTRGRGAAEEAEAAKPAETATTPVESATPRIQAVVVPQGTAKDEAPAGAEVDAHPAAEPETVPAATPETAPDTQPTPTDENTGEPQAETGESESEPLPVIEDTVADEPGTEARTDTQRKPEEIADGKVKAEAKADDEAPRARAAISRSAANNVPRTVQRTVRDLPRAESNAEAPVTPRIQAQEISREQPAAETATPRTPDQAEQIRTRVVENLQNDRMEFEMQLRPKELGSVNVKLVLEGGRLAMEIAAANPKSAELLTKQIDSLVASLKLSGTEVSSVSVVTARQDVSGQMAQNAAAESFQNQAGSRGQSGGRAFGGDSGGNSADYSDDRQDEDVSSPQRLLNYSI